MNKLFNFFPILIISVCYISTIKVHSVKITDRTTIRNVSVSDQLNKIENDKYNNESVVNNGQIFTNLYNVYGQNEATTELITEYSSLIPTTEETTTTTEITTTETTTTEITTTNVPPTTRSPCDEVPAFQYVNIRQTDSEIQLNWQPQTKYVSCNLKYNLWRNGSKNVKILKNLLNFTYKNLNSCTIYVISININNNGYNSTPVIKQLRTLPKLIHRVDMYVFQNMVQLSWSKPENSYCNKYNIFIGSKKYATKIRNNSYLMRGQNVFCKDIGVQVVGNNNLGGDIFYGQVAGKVRNLNVTNRNDSSITINWDPPYDDSCILGYQIIKNKEKPIYIQETTYTFSTTSSKQCYSNSVHVATLSDSNHVGEAVTLKYENSNVPDDEIGPVVNFTIIEEDSTLTATWHPPTGLEECELQYRLCLKNEICHETSNLQYEFGKIFPCRNYEISIVTFVQDKSGEKTNKNHIGKVYEIGAVGDFTLKENEGNLWASWSAPQNLEFCKILYTLILDSIQYQTKNLQKKFGSVTPCHFYEISIFASVDDIVGKENKTNYLGEVNFVGEVEDFHIIDENNYLYAKWKKPKSLEECPLNYTLILNDETFTATETHLEEIGEAIPCKKYLGEIFASYLDMKGSNHSINYRTPPMVLLPPFIDSPVVGINQVNITCKIQKKNVNMCERKTLYVTCMPEKDDNNKCNPHKASKSVPIGENDYITTTIQLDPYTNYICKASAENEAGLSQENEISLKTKPNVPPVPINLNSISTATSMVIQWDMPECIWGELEEYNIAIYLSDTFHYIPSSCETPFYFVDENVTNSEYRIVDIPSDSNFTIKIIAKTNGGFSDPLEGFKFTLPGLSENVTNLSYEAPRDENDPNVFNLNLMWDHPCNTNGPVDFNVDVQGKSYSENIKPTYRNMTKTGDQDNYNISMDIQPAFEYTIRISDNINNRVLGSVAFTTDEGVPEEPKNMSIESKMATGFLLRWDRPNKVNGFLINYIIIISTINPHYETECNIVKEEFEYEVNSTSFHFIEGKSFFDYKCTVKATTKIGEGKINSLNVTTFPTNPDPVIDITYDVHTSYSEIYDGNVQISFDKPCYINGNLDKYKIQLNGIRNDKYDNKVQETLGNVTFQLKPDYEYTISVEVKNKQNYTSSDITRSFTSPPGIPPKPEKIIKGPTETEDNPYILNFVLYKMLFSEENGDILYYSLILTKFSNDEKSFGTWYNTTASPYVITTPFWNPFKGNNLTAYTYSIGTGDQGVDFHNYALSPETKYYLKVRYFTRDTYRDTDSIEFITEKLRYNLMMVLIITFVILFALALLLFIYVKFKKRNFMEDKYNKKEDILLDCLTSFTMKQIPLHYGELKEKPMKLRAEYTRLIFEPGSTVIANMPINKKRNRYVDILPYDDTRVTLKVNDNGNDYVNASYIKGYSSHVEYIASQGPLAHTTSDFWNLIIQENVTLIVMLTQFVEANKIKCHKYIPNNHENMEVDDEIEVRCANELNFGTYISRTLHVQKDVNKWTIRHIQFVDWPDFGCPKDTRSLLEFCKLVRDFMNQSDGLALVHCSAGVGRTGTLIALDILLQTMNDNKNINVYETVFNLRKQRMKMVQTESQYMFIYTCLNDVIENPLEDSNDVDNMNDPIYENIEHCRKLT